MKLYLLLWIMGICFCTVDTIHTDVCKFRKICKMYPDICNGFITHIGFGKRMENEGEKKAEEEEEEDAEKREWYESSMDYNQLIWKEAKTFEIIKTLMDEREEAATHLKRIKMIRGLTKDIRDGPSSQD
ncbi:uncharacterized protein [Apostichopus japonicus]|uniref:uncharacterized protein isoform X2 n=1 Tax=Stichopus japonicus TaxID=307972 RepID=UPI003AB7C4DA